MAVRNTINMDLARKAMLASGAELLERMGHYLEGKAKQYCPVDTGDLWNSIVLVSAGMPSANASGSVDVSLNAFGASEKSAVHVVAYQPYAVYVEFGHFAGLRWVPPNPFMRNALADTQAAFTQIVNSEVFLPFRGGHIDASNAGSSSPRGPLAGPKF